MGSSEYHLCQGAGEEKDEHVIPRIEPNQGKIVSGKLSALLELKKLLPM